MKELIYVREKISKRIKSMSSDKEGGYAKKMMRRCIKDIDAVIEANKIACDVSKYNLDERKVDINAGRLAASIVEIAQNEERSHRLDILKMFLGKGIISNKKFLESITDGTI